MKLSVIVPVLDEERTIAATLDAVRRGAPTAEIIVADGGSADRTIAISRSRADRVIVAPCGRALQMNAGAALASGDTLVFVHADTIVPPTFAYDIDNALDNRFVVGGRFDVMLDDSRLPYRALGALISLRSRLMRSATGDQAIFVRRQAFELVSGFPEIELCEDVALVRALKRFGDFVCLPSRVTTSARRWRNDGFVRTILRMWTIKSLFMLGVSPRRLKRMYAETR